MRAILTAFVALFAIVSVSASAEEASSQAIQVWKTATYEMSPRAQFVDRAELVADVTDWQAAEAALADRPIARRVLVDTVGRLRLGAPAPEVHEGLVIVTNSVGDDAHTWEALEGPMFNLLKQFKF